MLGTVREVRVCMHKDLCSYKSNELSYQYFLMHKRDEWDTEQ